MDLKQAKTSPYPEISLRAAWRKLAMSTAIGASMVALAGCAGTLPAPQTTASTAAVTDSQTAPPQTRQPLTPEDRAQAVHDTLLADARAHYTDYARLAKSDYSDELRQLETRMSAWLRRNGTTPRQREVMLDPTMFDVGIAFQMTSGQVISAMLDDQQVAAGKNTVSDAVDSMFNTVSLRYLPAIYTQEPHALIDPDEPDKAACVVVPSSSHLIPFVIDGITHDTAQRFINRHESWHCLDDHYQLPPGFVAAQKKLDLKTPLDFRKLLNQPEVLERFAIVARKESLADTGALGDLIRGGESPALIDQIINWRSTQPSDVPHYSPPVLRALKAAIEDMGLAKFRKLSDTAARDLYYSLTDKNGMTGRQMGLLIRLETGDVAEKGQILLLAVREPEAARAVEMLHYDTTTTKMVEHAMKLPPRPLNETEKFLITALGSYNAVKELADTAFADNGRITPKTLTAAYGKLQNGLLHDRHNHPENDILDSAKLTKLQESYIVTVQQLDYLGANADRGLDITRVEPSLKALRGLPLRMPVPVAQNPGTPAPG